jgi:copper chaperone CopZ
MKQAFKLQGLGCANCAAKMERAIKALGGVSDVSVNLITTKMIIEGEDARFDEIVSAAQKIIKRLEPDVVVKKV